MRRILAAGAGLVLALLSHASVAAPLQAANDPAAPVLGRWLTEGSDGVFLIARCDDRLCGWLVGMRYTGSMPLDVWHRPQCNQALLTKFRPADDPGHWAGSILDPDNGHTYQATIWSPEPGVLKLRGYVLLPMLGETQRWTRYHGTIGANCKLPG